MSVGHIPTTTPATKPFFQAAAHGELHLQRCADCNNVYFPPRPFCPVCTSRCVDWFKASGKASLYSYVINYKAVPGWPAERQSVAMVKLEEGPMLLSCIVDCEQTPEALRLDMPLRVTFKQLADHVAIPVFRPARDGE